MAEEKNATPVETQPAAQVIDASEQVKPNGEAIQEDLSSLKSTWEEKEKNFNSQLQDYQSQVEKLKKFEGDYYTLLDQYTGKSIFANETIRKQNEILKKFPDKDPSVVSEVLSKFDSLSDVEALVLADKLNTQISGVTDSDRLAAILEDLGLSDVDLKTLEGKDKVRFQKEVAKAKQQLSELSKTELSDNGQFDIEAAKRARSEQLEANKLNLSTRWNPVNQTLLKSFNGYKQEIKDDKGNVVMEYTYQADDKFKQEYANELVETLMSANLEPSQENYQIAYNLINDQFASRNREKMFNDFYKQIKSKLEEEYHAKVHNDKPTQQGLNQVSGEVKKGQTLGEYARS